MELYHASKDIVQYPGIRKEKYTKDFFWKFYCTDNIQQTIRRINCETGEIVFMKNFD